MDWELSYCSGGMKNELIECAGITGVHRSQSGSRLQDPCVKYAA